MATTVRKLKRGKCRDNAIMSVLPIPTPRQIQDLNLDARYNPMTLLTDSRPIGVRFQAGDHIYGKTQQVTIPKVNNTPTNIVCDKNNIAKACNVPMQQMITPEIRYSLENNFSPQKIPGVARSGTQTVPLLPGTRTSISFPINHLLTTPSNVPQKDTSPPAYRMPPPALAPPEALPGTPHSAPAHTALRTHSAKFPIEREVVVPGGCGAGGAQVRALGGARRAGAAGAAVAPDAPPPPAVAWTHAQPERAAPGSPAARTPRAVARTYHTLRGIISNKLRSRDSCEPSMIRSPATTPAPANAALNNVDPHVNSSTPTHSREPNSTPSLTTPALAHPQEGVGYASRALCADALYGPPTPRRPHPDQRPPQQELRAQHPDPRAFAFTSLKPTAMHTPLTYNSQSDLSRSRPDLRSPQQLAREMIRQRTLAEGRRAASHPHLLAEPPHTDLPAHRPPVPDDRDSDDGGFRARLRAQGRSSFEERDRSTAPLVERPVRAPPPSRTPDPAPRRESTTPPTHSLQQGGNASGPTTAPPAAGGSGASSDYDKTGGQSSNVDSGRGSVAYSSGRRAAVSPHDTSAESDAPPASHAPPPATTSTPTPGPPDAGGEGEWADVVENELRQILEPRLAALRLHSSASSGSSVTPPLPPLSPPDDRPCSPSIPRPRGNGTEDRRRGRESPRWNSHKKHSSKRETHYKRHLFGLDTPELTSTTTRSLDLSSLLDARSDSDVSAGDARAIRRQLRGLENMYAEVLQLLGVRKPATYRTNRSHRPQWEGRPSASSVRRYGSASSLPSSSASGRPPRERRRVDKQELKNINKRFQRLEAHVVTLARSVAHLSSEMRTQHMVVREMESVRAELAALRALCGPGARAPVATSSAAKGFTDPARVRRLTKFFGDEPPLMRLFLKRLGYEKYAHLLEREKVGAAELPYVGEERLRALGLPLGPRARILREAGLAADLRDRDRDCTATTLAII